MGEVILGMPGPWADDNYEAADHYTTKIGGISDWPTRNFAVTPDLIECIACKSRLCLIAQIYAPISNKTLMVEERVIYIFGCVTPKCESWRALRVQKHVNDQEPNAKNCEVLSSPSCSASVRNTDLTDDLWTFDSGEDKDDDDDDLDLEELAKAFSEATSLNSNSKKRSSNSHPEATAKAPPLSQATRSVDDKTPVLPCFYLYTQKEAFNRQATSVPSKNTSIFIKENEEDANDNPAEETWEEEKYEYDKALNADRTYLKFKKRMDAYPEQCLRYSYGGKPLQASVETGDPGTCPLCGEPRHYEMQLMPPLLYFLQEATDYSIENWNWMTLILYTCSKSCSQTSRPEKPEDEDWIIAEENIVAQHE